MKLTSTEIHGKLSFETWSYTPRFGSKYLQCLHLLALFTGLCLTGTSQAQSESSKNQFTAISPALELIIGKSKLLQIPTPIERISVGNPNVADVALISPSELYILGKSYGSTNLLIWRKGGRTTAMDVNVSINADRMEKKLQELLPDEKNIRVRPAADSVILMGSVSSSISAKYAEDIANAFVRDINKNLVLPVGDGKPAVGNALAGASGSNTSSSATGAKVVNLLQVMQSQQVMLEVKVAEVSKSLLDRLGANLNLSGGTGMSYGILSDLLSGGAGKLRVPSDINTTLDANNVRTKGGLILDAEKKDGLIKVLAEPNIISISGQEASFLAGGKIFIPVARANTATGGVTVTLEEKEFGVGLKFTPTVLQGGLIHLKVSPEVSELSQTGSPFTSSDGTTSILPSVSTRRVQTTVQLMDGQSLAIAGLIKNNVTETVKRFPMLGEIPILGALFRSSEFQSDQTELMFLITPHLVKPLNAKYSLPTDQWTPPSRQEFFLEGKLEGSGQGTARPGNLELRQ